MGSPFKRAKGKRRRRKIWVEGRDICDVGCETPTINYDRWFDTKRLKVLFFLLKTVSSMLNVKIPFKIIHSATLKLMLEYVLPCTLSFQKGEIWYKEKIKRKKRNLNFDQGSTARSTVSFTPSPLTLTTPRALARSTRLTWRAGRWRSGRRRTHTARSQCSSRGERGFILW